METKIDQLNTITAQFTKNFAKLGNVLAEEQVCKIIIDPVIERLWDFTYLPIELNEPGTYETEVKVSVGHDTKVYPDRVLLCQNGKKLVIEAKGTDVALDEFVGQLETSVIASGASVGILWNGTEMRVYLTNNEGKMDPAPYKTILLMDMTDEDKNFLVNFFDPKHTINDGQMKREREARRKTEEQNALNSHIVNALITGVLQPSLDSVKEPYKAFKHQSQVQTGTVQAIYDQVIPLFHEELKRRLLGDAIAEAKRAEAMKNKIEPEEFAIANLVEYAVANNQGSVEWVDDGDASRSVIRRVDSKKTILWIAGEVDEINGYKFKGICFPNINKNKGKLIPITDPKEVVRGDLFKQLMEVHDHINDSVDAWKTFYSATFGE
jgi:hypothetical protein